MNSTLPSLRDQSATEIEGILANLTLEIMPNPGISGTGSDLTTDFRDRLIQEIRISLGLKRDDKSPEAMSRIYDYLAREMGQAALADVDIKEVKARLGDKGELAPPLYKIVFSDSFKHGSKIRGVDERTVEITLQSPNSVEHLRPELLGITSKRATSLYLRQFINPSRPFNSYSLLVFCTRAGYVQQVTNAWQVFHSDVDLSKTKSPLDVLKALVAKYGFEIQIGETKAAFFWHERVPISRRLPFNELIKFPHQPNVDFAVTWSPGEISDNSLELTYAFGINYTAYEADLVRHGIRIKRTDRPPPVRSGR
jgi:hypothetical protein